MNSLSTRTWSLLATATATIISGGIVWWRKNSYNSNQKNSEKEVFDPKTMDITLQLINLTSQDIIYYSDAMTKIHTFKPYPKAWSLGLVDKSLPQDIPYITANHGGGALKNGKLSVRHFSDWNHIIGLDDRLPGQREELQHTDVIVTPDVAEFLFRNPGKYQNVCRHVFMLDPTNIIKSESRDFEIGMQGLMYRGCLQPQKSKYTSLDLYLHLSRAK